MKPKKISPKQREVKALEAIICVTMKAHKEGWSKARWHSFWSKVYEKVDAKTESSCHPPPPAAE